MESAAGLLGPPVIRAARPPHDAAGGGATHPFLQLLDAAFNVDAAPKAAAAAPPPPRKARTENNSATYGNSGNTCLDFFFQVVPDTAAERVRELLAAAWAHDPLTALKLVCNLRGLRGTGKSDKEGFYAAALWMHESHPRTLACNVAALAEFGYLKDFPEMLFRLLHGADAPEKAPEEEKKAEKLAVQSLEKYYGDKAYRFLFDSVADFFAQLLASDVEQLAPGGKTRKIGLAAKWCPTPGSSFDKSTLLCEAIARRLFPRASSPDLADLSDEHYASAARRYKALFTKHDEERFDQYLVDVAEGKAKIAAGALLPHEISASAMAGVHEDNVSELQWRRMVDDLRAKGSLRNCIAVCDVSGSMTGTPMDVCVALGVLVSELSDKPWSGRVITFSERPEIHMITGKTLAEKLAFVKRMDWGMNTNFQAVFDQILRTAVDGHLPAEKMIRTIFVFSDMEFDQASSSNRWETDYEAICRKFRAAGYGDVVPQIVVWNFRHEVDSGDVDAARGRHGQRLLQEPPQALPAERWRDEPGAGHGRRHRRRGVPEARGV
uniref:VWFA domain-containing protein n=1 Tax=Leersia perrieri TaxID=77586 RepID=A0A0D9XFA0_9ORYZ